MKHEAYILLGANMGDKSAMFADACRLLVDNVGELTMVSGIYESEAWGFESKQLFYNQVLKVVTSLSPTDLLDTVLNIEHQLGRRRSEQSKGYESRTIDIDILLYDSIAIQSDTLTIPHPRMHLRMFTLAPLAELAPDYVHPVLAKTIEQLRQEVDDKGVVRRL